jgi:hypothetical protein
MLSLFFTLLEVWFHLEVTTYKNCTCSIPHTNQCQTTHQTIPNKMRANQLSLEHANDMHHPLTLFAAAIAGQTVAGWTTKIPMQEELMQQFRSYRNANPSSLNVHHLLPILLPEMTTISQVAEHLIESKQGYKQRECKHQKRIVGKISKIDADVGSLPTLEECNKKTVCSCQELVDDENAQTRLQENDVQTVAAATSFDIGNVLLLRPHRKESQQQKNSQQIHV